MGTNTPGVKLTYDDWVIDTQIDAIRVYRRDDRRGDRFARPVELSRERGDVLTTPILAGLEMPLARIFRS